MLIDLMRTQLLLKLIPLFLAGKFVLRLIKVMVA